MISNIYFGIDYSIINNNIYYHSLSNPISIEKHNAIHIWHHNGKYN